MTGTRGPRFHLVVCVKDEGPYLVDWVAHHRAIGASDLTVFSNDCSDGTDRILDRLQALGQLRHIPNQPEPGTSPQYQAVRRMREMPEVTDADWVMLLDIDEFLNIRPGLGRLDDLVNACDPQADAISINWRFFGSNGARCFEDRPVTERFTQGNVLERPRVGLRRRLGLERLVGHKGWPKTWEVKTLFRPDRFQQFDVHRPWIDTPTQPTEQRRCWLNGSGVPVCDEFQWNWIASTRETLGTALVQLNHYAVRSREEFLLKRLRGSVIPENQHLYLGGNRFNWAYWQTFDLNDREDRSLRLAPATAARSALMADAELADLHAESVLETRRRIERLYHEPEFTRFLDGQRVGVSLVQRVQRFRRSAGRG